MILRVLNVELWSALSRCPERKSIALTDRSEMTPCPTAFFFLTAAFDRRALAALTLETYAASARLKLENDNACLSLRRGSKRNGNCLRFCCWKGKTSAVCFQSINSNALISSLRSSFKALPKHCAEKHLLPGETEPRCRATPTLRPARQTGRPYHNYGTRK